MAYLTLPEFVARWQASTRNERSAAQEHFLNLCEALGQPRPAELDPTGDFYTFEKGAAKVGGGDGFADVWKRGFFAWEYKGKRKNLDDAYQQLLQYREDLENPPLLVVCDLNRFEVHTNFTGTAKRVYRFTLADLASPEATPTSAIPPIEVLRALFTEPARLRPDRTAAQVTEKAAAEFGLLAESLRNQGANPEQAAHFLMRILFCLFAEDTGLLPRGLFTQLVARTRTRPDDFNKRLRMLFDAMATGGSFGVEDIRHFNGGLFSDDSALPLTAQDLEILARASNLDWASVEPAIFGTLFERSLDPAKRSQLGAHYTSKEDILLIVEPVLMEPLRRRWEDVQAEAQGIIERREATADRGQRTRHQQALEKLLVSFADEIAAMKVLDPACGSGNFLYVALKRLLDLEKEVSIFAATNGLPGLFPKVDPTQLYGIEINPYAYELASVVVWIGYIQWLNDNGFGTPSSPILKPLHNIRHMDAILAYDADGKPIEPEWPKADVIIGNPPFLGGSKLRRELGDDYTNALWSLYAGRLPNATDLVTYWLEKARELIASDKAQRAGLLATQSIRGGVNRIVLERIKQTGEIFWAQSDRDWLLDGANVHVSMIGFDNGSEQFCLLDGKSVTSINANLTANIDVTHAAQLAENMNIAFKGPEPGGPFDIPDLQAQRLLAMTGNPNGKPNSDVVRPVRNASDLVQASRGYWTIDFGTMPIEVASEYEGPFEYLRTTVYPVRVTNKELSRRDYWWLYARPRPEMRAVLSTKNRFIATPRHAKHRIFVWLTPNILSNDATVVFGRDDNYFFGVLQSHLHEVWSLSTGTALEDRPRYTSTSTFETYPFPWPPGKEPQGDPRVEAIAEAARELVAKRDTWLNPPGATETDLKKRTLTNLYNERPTWLDLAHKKLDRAVFAAYGWPNDLTDEQILERLLALNLERASKQ